MGEPRSPTLLCGAQPKILVKLLLNAYHVAMTQVISFFAHHASQHSPMLLPASLTLDIDFSDVQRVHEVGNDGTPRLAPDDPVLLGPRAHAQVRELFWHYGLRQIPSTWGELEGNWDFCRRLHLWLIAMTPEEPESALKRLRTYHNQQQPGRGDLLWLLMNGDVDGAYAWHVDNQTFQHNALAPRRAPEKLRRRTA
jgi:hypothetical protein